MQDFRFGTQKGHSPTTRGLEQCLSEYQALIWDPLTKGVNRKHRDRTSAEQPLSSRRLYLVITRGEAPPPDEPQPAVPPIAAPNAPAQGFLSSPGIPEQRQSGQRDRGPSAATTTNRMPAGRPCAEKSRAAIATSRLGHRPGPPYYGISLSDPRTVQIERLGQG